MAELEELVELESDDPEYIPEILPVDARLSVRGPVSKFIELFERATAVAPLKEVIVGTMYSLLEAVHTSSDSVAHIRVAATDGDQTVSVVADGMTVAMAGTALLPGKKVLEILKSAPTAQVRIEVIGTTASIRSGRAEWMVKTPVGDALPPIPDVSAIELHDVAVEPFRRALSIARRAASTTSGRSSLMQVQIRNGMVTGADGGRLHRAAIEGFDTSLELAIPVKVVDELLKALRLTESEFFQLGSSEYHLVFRVDQDSLIAQRLLVPFPDVEPLLLGPAFSNSYSMTVDRGDLLEVIKRVRINTDPDYSAIFLAVVPDRKSDSGEMSWNLAIRARDNHGNAAQEILPVQWSGSTKARELCVNHRYITEFLAAYEGEHAVFKIGEDTKTVKTPLYLEDIELGFSGFVQQMHSNWVH